MKTLDQRKQTRTYQLLSFIKESPNGRRAGEIKKWLFEKIHPGKIYNHIENRGTWGMALYDSYQGIFRRWCTKIDGRWVMTQPMPDDMRAPLWHDPNSEFNFSQSAFHTIDLGNNLWTISEEERKIRENYKNYNKINCDPIILDIITTPDTITKRFFNFIRKIFHKF